MTMNDSPVPPASRRRPRLKVLAWGVVLGAMLAIGAIVVLLLLARDPTPRLTTAALQAAKNRWEANGPESYDVDVVTSGAQVGHYHVEVRNGLPTAVAREGRPPPRRVWDVWTVPGMFDTLDRELENAEQGAQGFGAAAGSRAVMRCVFDEQFGYPRLYNRTVLGASLDVRWEVTHFNVVSTP